MSNGSKSVSIPEFVVDTIHEVFEWVQGKLEGGDAWTLCVLTFHDDGNRMSIYIQDDTDTAWNIFQSELSDNSAETLGYIAASDVSLMAEDGPVRGIMLKVEHEDVEDAQEFFLPFIWLEQEGSGKIQVDEEMLYLGSDAEVWLAKHG